MKLIVFLFIGIFLNNGYYAQITNGTAMSRTIDNLFKNYDKRIRPINSNGTLDLAINCLILDVFNVDEAKHEFTVNMYLRHHWQDSRLKYTPIPGTKFILLDADHAQQMWTPDTFIQNERSAIRHNIGTLQEYTKILPNGRILQSARITVTASCRMNLGYFPFDRQLCGLELASYSNIGPGYTFSWTSDIGAAVSEDLSSSSLKFRFTGFRTTTKTLTYPSGNQTRLGLEFFFARHSIRYLQDVYFPMFVLTVIAFCTLYSGTILTRLQLGIFVTVTTVLFMNLNASWMPHVSYQTALDVFIFVSALTTFTTVLVNFVVYNFQKSSGSKLKQQGVRMTQLSKEIPEDLIDYDRCNTMTESLCEAPEGQRFKFDFGFKFGTKADTTLSLICKSKGYLPVFYLCFNIIYWMVVLIGSSWYPEGFLAVETQE